MKQPNSRTVHNYIVSAAAGIIAAVSIYVAAELNELTRAVTRMDERLSVVVRLGEDHEHRLRHLEKRP